MQFNERGRDSSESRPLSRASFSVKPVREMKFLQPASRLNKGVAGCASRNCMSPVRAWKEFCAPVVHASLPECRPCARGRKAKTEDEIDEIRIIENLVSRTVTPYEYALNIARLIEIYRKEKDFVEAKPVTPVFKRLAERLQISPVRLSWEHTISKLIPQLGQLLNDQVITQKSAYQLGQLPEDDQERIAKSLNKTLLEGSSEVKPVRAWKQKRNGRFCHFIHR